MSGSLVTARCRDATSLASCHPPFCLYARPAPVFQQSLKGGSASLKTMPNENAEGARWIPEHRLRRKPGYETVLWPVS